MSVLQAFCAERVFDGFAFLDDAALLVCDGGVVGIVPVAELPADAVSMGPLVPLLVPGFVDLQVNGGGGVLFNNAPTLPSIETICAAHARYGTTALLATLITDSVEVTQAAISAGHAAAAAEVPGFLGLHLEGPHLAVSRKGTHDAALIRPMTDDDVEVLCEARAMVPHLVCTVAPEAVRPEQVHELAGAGIIVSVGHSDASYAQVQEAFAAGASMVTHLFNAMSQLGNREPGVVGAALDAPHVAAGIIADGIHVHPATLRSALAAKRGQGALFLVTDAMAQTGTDLTQLTLNGRTITRSGGALRLADGTLAGADLDMIDAVRFVYQTLAVPLAEALRMASLYPATAIKAEDRYGQLRAGARADFVALDPDLAVLATWIGGTQRYSAPNAN